MAAFDRANLSGALGDDEPEERSEPAGEVVTVNPTVGRRRTSAGPKPLVSGSVSWDPDELDDLKLLLLKERRRKATQRAVHNVLLRNFNRLPAAEKRAVLDHAVAWEEEMRP